MRALITDGKGKLSIEEVRMPEYLEYQALVKMLAGGICGGTDIKIIHGVQKDFSSYPAILGHEGVGQVVETGSKVTRFKVGDIVTVPYLEEKIDGYYSRHGAFAETLFHMYLILKIHLMLLNLLKNTIQERK